VAAAEEEELAIELVEADMREFVRADAFDLAISLYTSFSYFEDQGEDRKVARNLCESLRSGGVLVMEMIGKEVLARIFQKRHWEETGDGTLFLQEHSIERGWSWIGNRWILVRNGEVKERRFGHRLYSAVELADLLASAGFAEVETYGDLGGEPYDHAARRLVAVARKQDPGSLRR
jgi:SAM-dependent methyltransferase